MRCEKCGTENCEGSKYCKECREPIGEGATTPSPLTEAPEVIKPTLLARVLSTAWSRKGPILIAISIIVLMSVVFAPWAFIEIKPLGISLVSRNFTGWQIMVPRALFFLSFIPLILAILMIAGVGTRRRVLETHICTFFCGVMFTIWLIIFALSVVLRGLVRHVQVGQVNYAGGQIATIILLIGFIIGIIVTTYDRGKLLAAAGKGG